MMIKEPELKLFGRNILFPEDKGRTAAGEYSSESSVESSNGGAVDCGVCWYVSGGENGVKADGEEKQGKAGGVLNHHHRLENEVGEEEEEICEASFQDLNQNPEESHDIPKTPPPLPGHGARKKPDKILPCPRCRSTDTKFCYFNNYNVNQPRHFCRACQRYWTHGGTTRNVPVGSGRRKNKTYHHHVPHPLAPADPNKGVLSFDQEIGPQGGPISTCYYYTVPVWHTGFPRLGPGKRSRADDPRQAAKSSIWSVPGVGCGVFRREGLLKGLQSRGDEKRSKIIFDSSLLQVNPAALARSMSFREGYEGNCTFLLR